MLVQLQKTIKIVAKFCHVSQSDIVAGFSRNSEESLMWDTHYAEKTEYFLRGSKLRVFFERKTYER